MRIFSKIEDNKYYLKAASFKVEAELQILIINKKKSITWFFPGKNIPIRVHANSKILA